MTVTTQDCPGCGSMLADPKVVQFRGVTTEDHPVETVLSGAWQQREDFTVLMVVARDDDGGVHLFSTSSSIGDITVLLALANRRMLDIAEEL